MMISAQLLPPTVTFFCPTATIIPEMSSLDVPPDNHPTDAVLVARCLAGDKAAFSLLISRHRPQLRRLLWTMLGDAYEVDDLLQESFLQAYLGLGQLRQPERFGAWVYGIALNLARMRLRSRPSSQASLEALPGGAVIGDALSEQPPLPEAAVEQLEVANQLHQAIASLPDAERQTVRFVLLEGLSHREAAAALGTTVGAVKVRLHRGRRRLRALLGADLAPARPALSFKEITMIGVRIDDVMLKIREEEPDGKPIPATPHRLVLLKETAGERVLPIWIGPCEAEWIAVQLLGKKSARPLTYVLMNNLLELGGLSLEEVVISRLHNQIFYGVLKVRQPDGQAVEVDCRPSDALTLAVHLDVPVRVASEVMDKAAIPPEPDGSYLFEREQDDQKPAAECAFKELVPGTAWRSFRSFEETNT